MSLISLVKYCIDTIFCQHSSTVDICSRIYIENSSKDVFDVCIMAGKVAPGSLSVSLSVTVDVVALTHSDSVSDTVSDCHSVSDTVTDSGSHTHSVTVCQSLTVASQSQRPSH